ncbi:MAG: small multidrug resistance family-3 protein [Acidobacteriota bacterium]|jgi:small multidrug resistance family-3 protein|nr:small multidrug resistance family-3 protein [Acidobacteriota bacterium]
MRILQPLALFTFAALCEIAGCFTFWTWLRRGRSPWLVLPGMLLLALFAWTLTRAPSAFAGRAYAAYGGIYVASSLLWLLLVERVAPDRWDSLGGLLCIAGALLILLAPR